MEGDTPSCRSLRDHPGGAANRTSTQRKSHPKVAGSVKSLGLFLYGVRSISRCILNVASGVVSGTLGFIDLAFGFQALVAC